MLLFQIIWEKLDHRGRNELRVVTENALIEDRKIRQRRWPRGLTANGVRGEEQEANNSNQNEQTALGLWTAMNIQEIENMDDAHRAVLKALREGANYYVKMWDGRYPAGHHLQRIRTCNCFEEYLQALELNWNIGGKLEHLALCHTFDVALQVFNPPNRVPFMLNHRGTRRRDVVKQQTEWMLLRGRPKEAFFTHMSVALFWGRPPFESEVHAAETLQPWRNVEDADQMDWPEWHCTYLAAAQKYRHLEV